MIEGSQLGVAHIATNSDITDEPAGFSSSKVREQVGTVLDKIIVTTSFDVLLYSLRENDHNIML